MIIKKTAIAAAIVGTIVSSMANSKTLVWEDNFDGDTIDTSVWTYDVGNSGWGNNELQNYTDDSDNAYIEDGNLIIQAVEESDGSFSSARLKSLGRLTYKYGTIEARIKLPDMDAGLWPAFWQLGSDYGQVGWPACGELDILEGGMAEALEAGIVNSEVSGAFHWWHESDDYTGQADYGESKNLVEDFGSSTDLTEDYHIFGMTWTPESIAMWVDDETNEVISIGTDDPAFDEFQQHHFLILNLAVGGIFPQLYANSDITAPMPAKMYVDYVRIYDNDDSSYSTELSFAADTAKSGNLGVYGDSSEFSESLTFGTDSELYVWNNMESQDSSDALEFEVGTGEWFGMGVWMQYDLNLMNYQNGHLNFLMKTTTEQTIGIGIASTSGGDAWVDLSVDGDTFGLERDGEWHEVSIPLSKFGVDFNTISQAIMVRGDAPSEAFTLSFDDIYFSESVDKTAPTGTFSIYSETTEADSTFELGTDGNLYIWGDTLIETSPSPYEGSESLSYTSSGAGWFGMAFTADYYYDLSAFDHDTATLNFALKSSSTTTFQIGMKSGSVGDIGQKWIEFTNGSDPYGFTRDGEWHQISIPVSDFSDEVDMSDVIQLFELLGVDGDINDIEIDNIHFAGGNGSSDDSGNDSDSGDDSDNSEAGDQDLTAQAIVTASSEVQSIANAVDGNSSTRWESAHGGDSVWVLLDLGEAEALNTLTIDWETANAETYTVQGSNDTISWTTLANFSGGSAGERTDEHSLSGSYRYVRLYFTERSTSYGYSIWELGLTGGDGQASSISATSELQSADLAIDGDSNTRWESAHGVDNVSLTYDLGSVQSIGTLNIDWETANAAAYTLLGSTDGSNWTTVESFSGMGTGERTDAITVEGNYRYLKIDCTERNTVYGYSIWEISTY
ncbi:discoidin domain-containing protein [Microbulbifer sp. VAAF005]|uniref:discoidin domain-containing protein n=1 Tax=Microbulbifer sp. VAAF005 TaxID=3034230 RepID=UPI0024AD2622|nr:discoidin domain-containing protein [Microbulbifer sp. VAAF005]WHI48150.1 discoidin domain-containing protein [Microbulbifer sp. VAAF005]